VIIEAIVIVLILTVDPTLSPATSPKRRSTRNSTCWIRRMLLAMRHRPQRVDRTEESLRVFTAANETRLFSRTLSESTPHIPSVNPVISQPRGDLRRYQSINLSIYGNQSDCTHTRLFDGTHCRLTGTACETHVYSPSRGVVTVVNLIVATESWDADQMPNCSAKTVVVTGANSGLGFETSKAFDRSTKQVISWRWC
jgi:hypothetical protein